MKVGQKWCEEHQVGYWPNQAWIHEGCVVVNSPEPLVVNKRSGDRHKNRGARKAYMRDYMRKRRAQ